MLASPGHAADADPVNRESAALQAIVLRAPLLDLKAIGTAEGIAFVTSFMEAPPSQASAAAAYAAASPVTRVTDNSPPTLLLRGDEDVLVARQGGRAGWPNHNGEMVAWFDRYLTAPARPSR